MEIVSVMNFWGINAEFKIPNKKPPQYFLGRITIRGTTHVDGIAALSVQSLSAPLPCIGSARVALI